MSPAIFRQVDLGIYSTAPTRLVSELACAAERRGFRRLWLAEDYHSRSAVVQAAAAASATAELELAFGIVSPFTRHPAVLAMEIATLEEQWGPRFVLGLGTARIALRAHGQETIRAVAGLREAGEICKRLLRGERVTYEGKVFRLPAPGVRLNVPPTRGQTPVYVGTLGPKGLSVAGALADGVLFSVLCSPGFVRKRVEDLRTGTERAGRSLADMDVACYIIFSVDEDGAEARHAAKELVATYLTLVLDPVRITEAGLSVDEVASVRERLLEADRAGRLREAAGALPDHVLRAFAVAGTPRECLEGLHAYAAAGVKTPVLYHVLGPDRLASVELIADRLLPELLRL